jgi:[ribosomal protein S5]-alanine N-acetyltransferase
MKYFLTTYRLGFRCWTEDDLPLAQQLWGDPAVTRLIGGPMSPEAVRARLRDEIEQMNRAGIQFWPIFLLEEEQFVGCAGLRPRRHDDVVFELGFHLCHEHWGKGLAYEASRAVVKYAFETLEADTLFAGHHPLNDRSRRLLLQLRFKSTGAEAANPAMIHPSYLLRREVWQLKRP